MEKRVVFTGDLDGPIFLPEDKLAAIQGHSSNRTSHQVTFPLFLNRAFIHAIGDGSG